MGHFCAPRVYSVGVLPASYSNGRPIAIGWPHCPDVFWKVSVRKFVILFAALAFSGSAFAADMAMKMPVKTPPTPASVYSWTGFYVGGNIGGGWTSGWNSTYSPIPSPAAFGGAPGSLSMNASGIVGGVQGGYNWQFTNWVIGVEGDFTWTHLNANAATQSLTFPGLAPGTG